MTFTEEELLVWTVDKLKNYLTTRGVTVSGGGGRKADLIRKVLAADLLQLPILPSMEAKEKEITDRRLVKLKVEENDFADFFSKYFDTDTKLLIIFSISSGFSPSTDLPTPIT